MGDQLLSCGISTQSHVEILVREVFEKARLQHNFIPMYTELAIRVEKWCASQPIGSGESGGFRKILLGACQQAFEHSLEPAVIKEGLSPEDIEEVEAKHKLANLGTIRYAGA